MKPADWKRLEELFARALELEPKERAAYLSEACDGDAELRREVEAMLEAHDADPSLVIEKRFVDPARDETEFVGRQLGPYRIRKRIGRGGMGEVYLAERDDPHYRREVAIKIVRAGLHGKEAFARFRQERQILARLDHPNIAQLFDGGVTEDGRPYLVMQYVEGVPITTHCNEERSSLEERIALFQVVARAVQHAHRNLVVHRDLKPSNILVTRDGDLKLLDFGIAKLLDPELAEDDAVATRSEVRLLTPEHAAPEQIRGETITTATDVYALGVLLYELLTDRRPHHREEGPGSSGSRLELERSICEHEPKLPSNVAALSTEHARFRRRLRGDLDNIVLKALKKNPDERYASAGQMLEDVTRYLNGQPVIARADTLTYRVAKFVRRYRYGVAAGAIFLALVTGFGIVSYRQSQAVLREQGRAQRTADFLTELFEVSNPTEARGESITAREILDRGAERLETELADEPDLRAHMGTVLGSVYRSLGLLPKAETLLTEAVALRKERLGPRHLDTLESMEKLGLVYKTQNRLADAQAIHRETSAALTEVLGEDHPKTASAIVHLATTYAIDRKLPEAEELYRKALPVIEKEFGAGSPEAIKVTNNLANVLMFDERYDESEPLFRRLIEDCRESLGDDHPMTLRAMNNLANQLIRQEKLSDAEPLHREALETRHRVLGEGHPETLSSKHNLARVFLAQGRFDEAEVLANETLEVRRRVLGPSKLRTITTVYLLGSIAAQRGDAETALVHFGNMIDDGAPGWVVENLAEDEELGTLRDMPEFQKLVELGRQKNASPE